MNQVDSMLLEIKTIRFNDKDISVFVVKKIYDKIKGASIFNEPQQNTNGMLFVGYNPFMKDIWMNGMKFPLDIYFLDENMNIIKSYMNAQPCNKFMGIGCEKYKSNKKYAYILELWK